MIFRMNNKTNHIIYISYKKSKQIYFFYKKYIHMYTH